MTDPATVAGIAGKLTKAQREALLNPQWIHPGGMDPICLVAVADPWPEGIAQFFTMRSDRLTPLGLAVRDYLERTSHDPD